MKRISKHESTTAYCIPSGSDFPRPAGGRSSETQEDPGDWRSQGISTRFRLHALASFERWGKETDLWDTYIRTDTQLITKKKLEGNAKNLDYFDAVIFYTTGELPLDDEQKASLLSFVRTEGKGFIGVHSAADTLYKWPEYGDMIGGWFDQHPWNTFLAPIIVEDKGHPTTAHLPERNGYS